jgi:ParB-like chromosome segregation protein Spo0J
MIRVEDVTEPKPMKRGIQDLAVGRVDLFRLNPRDLRIEEGWNSRACDFDPDDAEDIALAKSIAEVGVKQALTVVMKGGVPTITDGHRRLRATLYAMDTLGAEIVSVPVQTEPKHASEADRILSQIVRNSGKPFEPLEKANVFAKLLDLGWDEGTIAAKAGLTRQRVVDLLTLRSGPREVVAMVEAGAISAGFALDTIKAAKGNATAATETLVKAVSTAKAEGKTRATAKHVERKAPDLTRHPAWKAALRHAVDVLGSKGMADAVAVLEAEVG